MVRPQTIEDRVVELRTQGHSYGAIAKTLGLDQPQQAQSAFHRAVRERPRHEQRLLRDQELDRLDQLSQQIRTLPHLTDEQVTARLRAVDRLRRDLSDG